MESKFKEGDSVIIIHQGREFKGRIEVIDIMDKGYSFEDMIIGMIGALTSCLILRYSAKISESIHNIIYT